jgi:TolB-like protein
VLKDGFRQSQVPPVNGIEGAAKNADHVTSSLITRTLRCSGFFVRARQKSTKKRNVHAAHEHFESVFNAAMADLGAA